ncbi:MAG: hypothetical protein HYZ13_09285 [Acidobacteria bacterium]|nr:hypothetical protein [Acidobacteriota bacterium]
MPLLRAYALLGFVFLVAGILFDFLFLARNASEALKGDAVAYMASFPRYIHELVRTYLLVLGLLHLALAALTARTGPAAHWDWAAFLLLGGGSLILIATSFWYAAAGPALTWQPRCTVLTLGLLAMLAGTGLGAFRTLRALT